jgi:hypothetical protein
VREHRRDTGFDAAAIPGTGCGTLAAGDSLGRLAFRENTVDGALLTGVQFAKD